MNSDETIKNKLLAASLSESEMALWERTLGNMDENMKIDVLSAFNVTPDGVRILTDNLVVKTQALNSGDIKEWERVLEGDKAIIIKK